MGYRFVGDHSSTDFYQYVINLKQVGDKFIEYEEGAAVTERVVLSIKSDMNDFSRLTRSIILEEDYDKNMALLDELHQSIPNYFDQLHQSIDKITDTNDRHQLNHLGR